MKYKIPYTWVAFGEVEIDANNLEEAIEMVENDSQLPPDWEYLDSSFEINTEVINEINEADEEL